MDVQIFLTNNVASKRTHPSERSACSLKTDLLFVRAVVAVDMLDEPAAAGVGAAHDLGGHDAHLTLHQVVTHQEADGVVETLRQGGRVMSIVHYTRGCTKNVIRSSKKNIIKNVLGKSQLGQCKQWRSQELSKVQGIAPRSACLLMGGGRHTCPECPYAAYATECKSFQGCGSVRGGITGAWLTWLARSDRVSGDGGYMIMNTRIKFSGVSSIRVLAASI